MAGFIETVGVRVKKIISCVAKSRDQVGNSNRDRIILATVITKYKKKAKEVRNHEG